MTEKKFAYLSEIRSLACVAIVLLHTFYLALPGSAATADQTWSAMMVRNSLLWAVPCFVMVSGALLLDPSREISVQRMFRDYLRRILLVLLLVTFVFTLFDVLLAGNVSVPGFLKLYLTKLWTNGSWPHLWYLYLLIALYLMLPLYRRVTQTADPALLRYAIVLFFIFLSVLPSIGYLTGKSSGFYLLSYTVYPFYFFIGYALHTGTIRLSTGISALLLIAGTVALLLCTHFSIRLPSDALRSLSGSYASVAVAGQAVGLFSLWQKRNREGISLPRGIAMLDAHSFGIYLFHVFFIYLFYRVFRWNPLLTGHTWQLIPLAVLMFLLSWALTYVLRRIPGLRKIF